MFHGQLYRLTLTMHAKLMQDFPEVIADRREADAIASAASAHLSPV